MIDVSTVLRLSTECGQDTTKPKHLENVCVWMDVFLWTVASLFLFCFCAVLFLLCAVLFLLCAVLLLPCAVLFLFVSCQFTVDVPASLLFTSSSTTRSFKPHRNCTLRSISSVCLLSSEPVSTVSKHYSTSFIVPVIARSRFIMTLCERLLSNAPVCDVDQTSYGNVLAIAIDK